MPKLFNLIAGFAARIAFVTSLLILLLLYSSTLAFANHIPAPTGHVNDFAGVLTSQQKATLESDLSNYKQQTGNEIAVALVRNLDGGEIDDFTVRTFEEWKIGKEKEDNGLLFLAAIEDRKMRIEPGYVLEPYLTDSEAGSIIRDVIAPEFKQEKYFDGLVRGLASVKTQLSTENVPQESQNADPWWLVFLEPLAILLFVVVPYLGAYMARSKSIWLGGTVGSGIGLVIGLIATSLIISLVAAITLGILGTVLDYILSAVYQKRKVAGKPTDWWHTGGGFFGGRSGGGFGGFGGGSSGGGGASGGW